MARRKKPNITANDPAYSHQFKQYRPVKSNMPDDVIIPGIAAPTPPQSKPEVTNQSETSITQEDFPQVAVEENDDPKITENRRLNMDLAITEEHVKAMQPLIAKGISKRDILALAGQRTNSDYKPSDTFIPLPKGNRLPLREGYRTTKMFPSHIVDALREKHDPLRVRSDAAMLRGQYESLFWKNLDGVIIELKKKYLESQKENISETDKD